VHLGRHCACAPSPERSVEMHRRRGSQRSVLRQVREASLKFTSQEAPVLHFRVARYTQKNSRFSFKKPSEYFVLCTSYIATVLFNRIG
jgi:hypothetical protein